MLKVKDLVRYLQGEGEGEGNLNAFMRYKQNIIGVILLLLLLVGAWVLHHLSAKKQQAVVVAQEKSTHVAGILSSDFTKKNELSALEQQQGQLDGLQEQMHKLQKTASIAPVTNKKVVQQILAIEQKRQAAQYKLAGRTPFNAAVPAHATAVKKVPSAFKIEHLEFDYAAILPVNGRVHDLSSHKTPRTYVPAGTFARGVLLEGADANASVNGQADTVPILIRILDNGTLPNGHHSSLRGCFVLASLYGDISSERGEARLTKLSCTRKDGVILETKVRGYLSFAGKEGIKGNPVMRNGKILAMAGVSGLLSGIGSALQQSTLTQSVSPLGTTSTVNPNKIWQNGLYGGANSAMNTLAGYYIKRADQYHPVIEIGSGTVASLVFQDGFSLLGKVAKHHVAVDTPAQSKQEITALLKQAQHLSAQQSPFSNLS